MLSSRTGRTVVTLALSGALLVGVAACGSASTSASSASGSGISATASTSSASARYQARLALAKCLRSHGLNVPDPSPNGTVPGGGGLLRTLRDQPNFQSAVQACAKYRRGAFGLGTLTPAQRAQLQQHLVKFAECMRAHNINVPDPTTSAGGGFRIFRQIPSSERNSPAFQTALQACSTNLPRRPGAPGGGAGAAPGGTAANPGA